MEAAPARLLLETFTCYQRAASGTTEGIFPFIKVYHLLTRVLIQIKVEFQNCGTPFNICEHACHDGASRKGKVLLWSSAGYFIKAKDSNAGQHLLQLYRHIEFLCSMWGENTQYTWKCLVDL